MLYILWDLTNVEWHMPSFLVSYRCFTAQKICTPPVHPFLLTNPWQPLIFWLSSWFCHSLTVFFFFFLFRATPAACGSPRLGVKLELQLLAYPTATATPDPSCIGDLCHSLQRQILNSLREARDQTCILMGTSQFLNLLSHHGNSPLLF